MKKICILTVLILATLLVCLSPALAAKQIRGFDNSDKSYQYVNLGTYPTFAMIGATISDMFGCDLKTKGESLLPRFIKD